MTFYLALDKLYGCSMCLKRRFVALRLLANQRMERSQTMRRTACAVVLAVGLAACGGQQGSESINNSLSVVATTGLIADVARQVAGDRVTVVALMEPGQDAHTFEPTPADAARLQKADLVLANGLGYEENLAPILDELEAGGRVRIVYVSNGVDVLAGEKGSEHAAGDPHTWMDPHNVVVWADNIAAALEDIDPSGSSAYQANADAYKVQLAELDTAIARQVDAVPQANRKLVTDHETLGYFARRYGFEITGAVIPTVTTSAEPSAADLASLITVMREKNVKTIFVGASASDILAQQVAAEIGYPVQVLRLYHDLGAPGSGADTYLSMMRVDAETIMRGLAPDG